MTLDLFRDYTPSLALRRYRTAPPGLKVKRRREWVLATARGLI
jgi:hypothetical protein